MATNLYNGKIINRNDTIFPEGDKDLHFKFADGTTPFDMLKKALRGYSDENGCSMWIKENGDIEILEPAA